MLLEAWTGIEPVNEGFADPCLTAWPPRHSASANCLERVTGVGPVSPPWQGDIIPLYHTRSSTFQSIINLSKSNGTVKRIAALLRSCLHKLNSTKYHFMGQKSRSKRQQEKKPPVSAVVPASVSAPATPSLVSTSSTFQPKRRGPVLEELLQVRRSDILKIVVLIAIMLVLLAASAIVNNRSSVLAKAGQRLSHAMRIQ